MTSLPPPSCLSSPVAILDCHYMAHALTLARQGEYTAHPNPRVGCVIVKAGKVVGEGAHLKRGQPHAEVIALAQAGENARGATCYVTLEPCDHQGLTPPCTTALIQANIKRIVLATQDPNPIVSGKGIQRLKQAGIEVQENVLALEAEAVNKGFFSRMRHQKPWVRGKMALSLDGRSAMSHGESQWITHSDAREDVQKWRAQSGAIMTGVDTLLCDDPQLTVRDPTLLNHPVCASYFEQPLRIVLDSHLRSLPHLKFFQAPGKKMVVISEKLPPSCPQEWQNAYIQRYGEASKDELLIVRMKEKDGQIDLSTLLSYLAQTHAINDLFLEAGHRLMGGGLKSQVIDELCLYFAPKLLGHNAKGLAYLPEIQALKDHIACTFEEVMLLGADIRVRARIQKALSPLHPFAENS